MDGTPGANGIRRTKKGDEREVGTARRKQPGDVNTAVCGKKRREETRFRTINVDVQKSSLLQSVIGG